MVTSERYERQTRIVGWDQKKLEDSSIYLIGSQRLSDFMLVDLLSLGFGRVYRIGESDYLNFKALNPEVYLEQTGEEILTAQDAERIIIPDSSKTVVVDCTNNPKSKFFSSAVSKSKGLKYYSGCSSQNSFSFSSIKYDKELIKYHQEINHFQGLINSMICSAMLTDEIRKYLMPIKSDLVLEEYEKTLSEPGALEKKIVQVGAGATGTFSAMALAHLGADILLIDKDVVHPSNLNRQFLFYDSIGLNKAKALAERIRDFGSGNSYFLEKEIGEDFMVRNFDFMLSCVDNNDARRYMHNASKKSNTPLINCGSSIEGASACVYSPNKTACLECQIGLSEVPEKKDVPKRAVGDCFNPSLIIPNQIAGAFLVKTAYDASKGNYNSWNYQSGLGVEEHAINPKCFGGCKNKNG